MGVKLDYTPSPASGYDLKNMQVEGNYYLDGSYLNAHTTDSFQGLLNVTRYNFTGQKCVQTITTYTNPPRTFRRLLDIAYGGYAYGSPASGGTWSEILVGGQGFSGNITFDTTNKYNIASANATVANIYTQNAVTVVSDRKAKNSIQAIDDKVLDAWSEVEQKQYKLNGDDNWSFGYIAQDIVESFTRHGLDYKQYNIVHEEDGKFMLKYDMCDILESALNRRKLK